MFIITIIILFRILKTLNQYIFQKYFHIEGVQSYERFNTCIQIRRRVQICIR
jgi:hypothetical protein